MTATYLGVSCFLAGGHCLLHHQLLHLLLPPLPITTHDGAGCDSPSLPPSLCLGSWQVDIAFFFISYFMINSVMMLNVVVAILLDEFIATVTREKEAEEKIIHDEKERRKVNGCLDPLTETLLNFDSEADLKDKIDAIFALLDVDGSGGLDFEEVCDCTCARQ